MNHSTLMKEIDKRIDRTDSKIDDLQKEIRDYAVKTAVLEAQVAGIIRVGMVLTTAAVGILAFAFQQGVF